MVGNTAQHIRNLEFGTQLNTLLVTLTLTRHQSPSHITSHSHTSPVTSPVSPEVDSATVPPLLVPRGGHFPTAQEKQREQDEVKHRNRYFLGEYPTASPCREATSYCTHRRESPAVRYVHHKHNPRKTPPSEPPAGGLPLSALLPLTTHSSPPRWYSSLWPVSLWPAVPLVDSWRGHSLLTGAVAPAQTHDSAAET